MNEKDSRPVIDMHCHVGVLGDEFPQWGRLSDWYRRQLVYKTFLLYAGLKADEVSDRKLRERSEQVISECRLDHVVCLALDPVYDEQGVRREERSHVWADNDYILDLRRSLGKKVLLGASVHPFDPQFEARVTKYVEAGAVLLKWLPSAQQFNLADERIRERLRFLATCRDGEPLPLLLHVGVEYAIPSSDPKTTSYDFLSWSTREKFENLLRFNRSWHPPELQKLHENLRAGLADGVIIIFAHCGLPYFAPNLLRKFLEHSDFDTVRDYLNEYAPGSGTRGCCYADLSACSTPFRRSYFSDIAKLPPQSLLFGSDFPTPVFELSADLEEKVADFKAVMDGDIKRIVIPQDNLLDVNYRELSHFFPGHPMFTNFGALRSTAAVLRA